GACPKESGRANPTRTPQRSDKGRLGRAPTAPRKSVHPARQSPQNVAAHYCSTCCSYMTTQERLSCHQRRGRFNSVTGTSEVSRKEKPARRRAKAVPTAEVIEPEGGEFNDLTRDESHSLSRRPPAHRSA